VIRVYDAGGNVIETREHKGQGLDSNYGFSSYKASDGRHRYPDSYRDANPARPRPRTPPAPSPDSYSYSFAVKVVVAD